MAEATDILAENPIHEPLESSDSITETLRHDDPLKQTQGSFEGRFVNIQFFHETLVVRHRKIHLGEDPAPSSRTNDVVLTRKGSMIFDGIVIEGSIIVDDTRGSVGILLGDEEGTGGIRTLR